MIVIEPGSLVEQSQSIAAALNSEQELLTIAIDDHHVQLSQLDEPVLTTLNHTQQTAATLTRRHLLQYYTQSAPHLLPLLKDRPLTVKQFSKGLDQPSVTIRHTKEFTESIPEYVSTVFMYSEYTGENEQILLCQNLASLLWLINAQAFELYPWLSRINPDKTNLPAIFINSPGTLEMSVANYPDVMVFNLSGSQAATQQDTAGATEHFHDQSQDTELADQSWSRVVKAARLMQQFLESKNLHSFIKTSGRGGLHIMVPIQRQYTFAHVKAIAQRLGQQAVAKHEDILTMGWQIDSRQNRVFLDVAQNIRSQALVSAFSLRSNPQALVSMPITWKQLDEIQPDSFSLFTMIQTQSETEIDPDVVLPQPYTQADPPASNSSTLIKLNAWRNLFKDPQLLPEA